MHATFKMICFLLHGVVPLVMVYLPFDQQFANNTAKYSINWILLSYLAALHCSSYAPCFADGV